MAASDRAGINLLVLKETIDTAENYANTIIAMRPAIENMQKMDARQFPDAAYDDFLKHIVLAESMRNKYSRETLTDIFTNGDSKRMIEFISDANEINKLSQSIFFDSENSRTIREDIQTAKKNHLLTADEYVAINEKYIHGYNAFMKFDLLVNEFIKTYPDKESEAGIKIIDAYTELGSHCKALARDANDSRPQIALTKPVATTQSVIIYDESQINTIAQVVRLNANKLSYLSGAKAEYLNLLDKIDAALKDGDLYKINKDYLPKINSLSENAMNKTYGSAENKKLHAVIHQILLSVREPSVAETVRSAAPASLPPTSNPSSSVTPTSAPSVQPDTNRNNYQRLKSQLDPHNIMKVVGKLSADGWSFKQDLAGLPLHNTAPVTVTKGKDSFTMDVNKFTTSSISKETFTAILIAFQASNPGKQPNINISNMDFAVQWQQAYKEVYKKPMPPNLIKLGFPQPAATETAGNLNTPSNRR